MVSKLPNPGSPEARKLGCTCPVLDNNNGHGVNFRGTLCFWYDDNCPVHKVPQQDITSEVTKDATHTDGQRGRI